MEYIKVKFKENLLFQVLSSVALSVLFFLVLHALGTSSLLNLDILLLGAGLLLAVGFAAFFLKGIQWEHVFLYLLIATSFLGAGILSVNVGPFSLFPYRLFFVLSLAIFVYQFLKGQARIYNSKVKFLLLFFYFWLGYGFLSLLWAKSITEGVKYLILLFIGIALITLVNVYFTKRLQYLNLFYIWIIMTVVLVGIGLWNHFTRQHLAISTINTLPEHVQGVPTAVFVNQNDYAVFLSIGIFFFISFLKFSQNQYVKLANLGMIGLSLYLIYLTSSRASMLGLGVGLALYVFMHFRPKLKKFLILLGGIGAAGVLALYSGKVFSILEKFKGEDFDPNNMGSTQIRINLTKNAFHFIGDTLGFGVGAGNSQVYLESYSAYFTRGIYKMHNWWLEIFSNFGVFIFVGYVLVFSVLIVSFYRFWKQTGDSVEKMIAEALLFSLITFIPASISPSSVSNLFFHWVLIAFSIGFLNYIRNKPTFRSRVY
ncbi:O-antigen ligase family protein [Rossellomorea vietnamensis]|uniref:O-antigen ligase family protein n=1 Tax=Rossellomorea aquimaris TaxID=189382 RepID=A0A5D4TLZ1_9BACI|nr:O-antigen ligase family protein [Rossellomorea aquimaris]TYS75828.1 O-antigen ligase family protein [Rossellomorea aquimaris]